MRAPRRRTAVSRQGLQRRPTARSRWTRPSGWSSGAFTPGWSRPRRKETTAARSTCCAFSATRARCGPSGWTPGTGWFNRRAKKRGGMRVLVVEDEATLRDSLKERLAAAGFTVDVARDGNEGLFAGLEYPLDVAIVDLGLPNLPGLEVICKTELTERLYDQDLERDSNVIEVLVGRLRRKLDPRDELHPIETLRGRGYRFALPRDSGS